MGKDVLTFEDIETEKNYHQKTPILLRDIGTEKVIVPNKILFAEKNYRHFIGYLYDNLSKLSHYI